MVVMVPEAGSRLLTVLLFLLRRQRLDPLGELRVATGESGRWQRLHSDVVEVLAHERVPDMSGPGAPVTPGPATDCGQHVQDFGVLPVRPVGEHADGHRVLRNRADE